MRYDHWAGPPHYKSEYCLIEQRYHSSVDQNLLNCIAAWAPNLPPAEHPVKDRVVIT